MYPLEEWDANYLLSIATPAESAALEKKGADLFDPAGAKNNTSEKLAKQVCAFSNSGDGFLVFGIRKEGGLDRGVCELFNRQPIKAWVEQIIPDLLTPQVHGCQARFIQVPEHHQPGRGALVVYIPLSRRRPHWVRATDVAYIRAGEHSLPMRPQTLLDISHHGDNYTAVIEELNVLETPTDLREAKLYPINPIVRLVSGPLCDSWYFEMTLPEGKGTFVVPSSAPPRIMVLDERILEIHGVTPLFPGRSAHVSPVRIQMFLKTGTNFPITARLWLRSGKADEKTFWPNQMQI